MKPISGWILAAQSLILHARAMSCFNGAGAEVILTPGDGVNATFPHLNFTPTYAVIYTTEGEEQIKSFVLPSPVPCARQRTSAYTITLGADYPAGKSNIEFIDKSSTHCVTVRVGQAVSADQTYNFEAYCFANTTSTDIANINSVGMNTAGTRATDTTLITTTTHQTHVGTGTPHPSSMSTGSSSSGIAHAARPSPDSETSITSTSSATTTNISTDSASSNATSSPNSEGGLGSTNTSVASPKDTTSENTSPTNTEEPCPCRT